MTRLILSLSLSLLRPHNLMICYRHQREENREKSRRRRRRSHTRAVWSKHFFLSHSGEGKSSEGKEEERKHKNHPTLKFPLSPFGQFNLGKGEVEEGKGEAAPFFETVLSGGGGGGWEGIKMVSFSLSPHSFHTCQVWAIDHKEG